MSRKPLVMALAIVALAHAPAFGQEAAPQAPVSPSATAPGDIDPRLLAMRIDDIDDRNVHDASGTEIGEIEEIVRGADGVMAVVEIEDGFLGIGGKDILVPMTALRMEGDRLVLSITEEQAKAMPEYRAGQQGFTRLGDDLALGEAIAAR